MRVLLSGAAGFVGSHALAYFAHRYADWIFFAIDRLNYASSLDRLATLPPGIRLRILRHDFAAPINDHLRDQLGDLDYVIHFGAETSVDKSLVEPEPFIQSNIVGTFNLLEFCRLHQPRLRMFVQVSTDEVFGPAPPGVDFSEDAPHRPSNPYAGAKAAAEDLVLAWEHSMGVPTLIARCMNAIGETQHTEKFVPRIVRSIRRGEMLTVHGSPETPGSRTYIDARDIADAINFLLREGRRGESYNIVGPYEVNNLELVRLIEKIMGREARIQWLDFHAARPGHDRRYGLSHDKMTGLGWTAPTPIDETLQRIVRFSEDHPEWA